MKRLMALMRLDAASRFFVLHILVLLCQILTHCMADDVVVAGERDAAFRMQVGLHVTDRAGRRSHGSAIIWSADGLLVTAAHVVENAGDIRLATGAGEVRLIGFDPLSDIALLKARTLPPGRYTAIPASQMPGIGMPVRAVGNPLGFADTVTAGIVSGQERLYRPASPYGLIQHDAALNPGSSGGPLIDAEGRLVGMNVAIADGSRRHVGIGFAVPITVLVSIVTQLEKGGEMPRPHLGLRLRDHAGLRGAVSALGRGGLLIEDVAPGSAAEAAGLRAGDLLMEANGQSLNNIRDLALRLEPLRPGESLHVRIRRGTAIRDLSIRLEAVPGKMVEARLLAPKKLTPKKLPPRFGLGLDRMASVIRHVEPGSPAYIAGLAAGDTLLAIGERGLATSTEALAALDAAGSGPVALLVRREGRSRYVVLGGDTLDAGVSFGMNNEATGSEAF